MHLVPSSNGLQLREFAVAISSVCVGFAFLAVVGVAAQQLEGSDEYRDDVEIEWRRNDAGVNGVRASFLVKSTRNVVWAVLLDYARFPEVFRNVRRAKVLKESVDGAEVEFVVNAKIRDLHYVLDRRYVEHGRRIAWTKISGDLRTMEGGWTIDDGPQFGLLRMTYESYVEVGWYVPGALVRRSAMQEVREMVRALRARLAESAA